MLLVGLLILLLAGGTYLYNAWTAGDGSAAGLELMDAPAVGEGGGMQEDGRTAAPDFSMVDAEGNKIQLTDFVGKPAVLNFWASWCAPCRVEMPAFENAYSVYGDRIHFLMVNMTDGRRETLKLAQDYLTEQGHTFPAYFDQEGSAAIPYSITAIPATYFIDAEGYLVAGKKGTISEHQLLGGIELLLPEPGEDA